MDVPLEEKLRAPGKAIPDGGIQVVGGGVPLPGVQADDRLALGPGGLLAKGHHALGEALPGLGRVDAEGVDHPHLLLFRGNGPGDFAVLRQLDAVEVHHAP